MKPLVWYKPWKGWTTSSPSNQVVSPCSLNDLIRAIELACGDPLIICLPWDQALRLGLRLIQGQCHPPGRAARRMAHLEGKWVQGTPV